MKKLLLFAALLAATSGIAQVTNTRNQASGPQEAMPFPATSLRATSDSLEAASEYAGGSGTEADPYLIETPEQFMKLAQDATGDGIETYLLKGVYFKQTADIDLSGLPAYTIGNGAYFCGIYDGNGYSIKGYTLQQSISNYQEVSFMPALFMNVKDAVIKNLTLEDFDINLKCTEIEDSRFGISPLIALALNSRIENCVTKGHYALSASGVSNSLYIGGIVSLSNANIINDCHAYGTIDLIHNYTSDGRHVSYSYAGGITAYAEGGTIINCTNHMAIQSKAEGTSDIGIVERSGGIFGKGIDLQILNCANEGPISGEAQNTVPDKIWLNIAGIGGKLENGLVQNCWNAGELSSIGRDDWPALSILSSWSDTQKINNYADIDVEGAGVMDGDIELGTSYMQSEAFVSDLNENLPEGGMEWAYQEGDYPTLRVEESTPDANEQIHVSNTTFRLTPEGVEINAEQATEMAIYTMQGIQKAARQIPAGTTSIALAPGIYILQLNGEGHKIVIR